MLQFEYKRVCDRTAYWRMQQCCIREKGRERKRGGGEKRQRERKREGVEEKSGRKKGRKKRDGEEVGEKRVRESRGERKERGGERGVIGEERGRENIFYSCLFWRTVCGRIIFFSANEIE